MGYLALEQYSVGQSSGLVVACCSNLVGHGSDRLFSVEAVPAGMHLAICRGHLAPQYDPQVCRF
jgi:hypothetical protein